MLVCVRLLCVCLPIPPSDVIEVVELIVALWSVHDSRCSLLTLGGA